MNAIEPNIPNRSRKLGIGVIVVMCLTLGLLAGVWLRQPTVNLRDIQATVLEPPGILEDFSLLTHEHLPFTRESLQGKWSFVFFGYTHCPDVCPTTLHTLTKVSAGIEEAGTQGGDVQVIFVSVDPERDTAERLAEYVPYFDRSFIGVTGTQAEINRFTTQLGILHVRMERDDEDNYLVNHSSSILLFDKQGNLRALFSEMPHTAQYITENFLRIVQL